jgi:hypothetical protein
MKNILKFTKHFSNSNRSKARDTWWPQSKKEWHRITFSGKTLTDENEQKHVLSNHVFYWICFVWKLQGLFVGCTLDLILALTLIIHARNILDKKGKDQYMENMFPLYRFVTCFLFTGLFEAFMLPYFTWPLLMKGIKN